MQMNNFMWWMLIQLSWKNMLFLLIYIAKGVKTFKFIFGKTLSIV
jgi:hypothetical protein